MQMNRDLIKGKIDVIERNLDFLEQYKKVSIKDFLKSYKDIQAVKYSLLEIIESCIDIASHIISFNGFERPESYSEMFEILGKNNLLNSNLSKKLSEMAKFRNLLVHSYDKIENSKILSYLKEELDDVKEYIKELLNVVKE